MPKRSLNKANPKRKGIKMRWLSFKKRESIEIKDNIKERLACELIVSQVFSERHGKSLKEVHSLINTALIKLKKFRIHRENLEKQEHESIVQLPNVISFMDYKQRRGM